MFNQYFEGSSQRVFNYASLKLTASKCKVCNTYGQFCLFAYCLRVYFPIGTVKAIIVNSDIMVKCVWVCVGVCGVGVCVLSDRMGKK